MGTMSIDPELKWVGAILFSVGLFVVFTFGLDLYTGKVGYMFNDKPWTYGIDLLLMLVGNFIGALFIGLIMPMSEQFVPGFIDARLNTQDLPLAKRDYPHTWHLLPPAISEYIHKIFVVLAHTYLYV